MYDWDCLNYVEDEEPPRPEFAIHAYAEKRNPVTRQLEPSFPSDIRKRRMVTGYVILLFMVRIFTIYIMYDINQIRQMERAVASWTDNQNVSDSDLGTK